MIVDVSGAVERPGVYQLPNSARINDALVAAGGFSQGADRVWVTRYLNLAQVVPDGAKIYIPVSGEDSSKVNSSSGGKVAGAVIGAGQPDLININTATSQELDSLWGIGEVRARDIVSNRPYQNIEELKSKAGIPENVFERIKGQITL